MRATVKVVGMLAGGREDVVAAVSLYDPVLLVPEPDNPYDEHAVAVWTAPAKTMTHPYESSVTDPQHVGRLHPEDRGWMRQAGYLPRGVAATLDLPDGGVVGWVSQVRHAPTEYRLDGTPVEGPVVGFDVTAHLNRLDERHTR